MRTPKELVASRASTVFAMLQQEDAEVIHAWHTERCDDAFERGRASIARGRTLMATLGASATLVGIAGVIGLLVTGLIWAGNNTRKDEAYAQLERACIERVLCECEDHNEPTLDPGDIR